MRFEEIPVLPSSHFRYGTHRDFETAIDELRWLKAKGQLTGQSISSIAARYSFPEDLLQKGLTGLSPSDYMVATSEWWPVMCSWASQRREAWTRIKNAYIMDGMANKRLYGWILRLSVFGFVVVGTLNIAWLYLGADQFPRTRSLLPVLLLLWFRILGAVLVRGS